MAPYTRRTSLVFEELEKRELFSASPSSADSIIHAQDIAEIANNTVQTAKQAVCTPAPSVDLSTTSILDPEDVDRVFAAEGEDGTPERFERDFQTVEVAATHDLNVMHYGGQKFLIDTQGFPGGYTVRTTRRPDIGLTYFEKQAALNPNGTTHLWVMSYPVTTPLSIVFIAPGNKLLPQSFNYHFGIEDNVYRISGFQGLRTLTLPTTSLNHPEPISIEHPGDTPMEQLWGLQWIVGAKEADDGSIKDGEVVTPSYAFDVSSGKAILNHEHFPAGFQVRIVSGSSTVRMDATDIPPSNNESLDLPLQGSGSVTVQIIDYSTGQKIGMPQTFSVSNGTVSNLWSHKDVTLKDLSYRDGVFPTLELSKERAQELYAKLSEEMRLAEMQEIPTQGNIRMITEIILEKEDTINSIAARMEVVTRALTIFGTQEERQGLTVQLAKQALATLEIEQDYASLARIGDSEELAQVDQAVTVGEASDVTSTARVSSLTIPLPDLGGTLTVKGLKGDGTASTDLIEALPESRMPTITTVSGPLRLTAIGRDHWVDVYSDNAPDGTVAKVQYQYHVDGSWKPLPGSYASRPLQNGSTSLHIAVELPSMNTQRIPIRLAFVDPATGVEHDSGLRLTASPTSSTGGWRVKSLPGIHEVSGIEGSRDVLQEQPDDIEPEENDAYVLRSTGSGMMLDLATSDSLTTQASFTVDALGSQNQITVNVLSGETVRETHVVRSGDTLETGEYSDGITTILIHAPSTLKHANMTTEYANLLVSDITVSGDRSELQRSEPETLPVHSMAIAKLAQQAWAHYDPAEGRPSKVRLTDYLRERLSPLGITYHDSSYQNRSGGRVYPLTTHPHTTAKFRVVDLIHSTVEAVYTFDGSGLHAMDPHSYEIIDNGTRVIIAPYMRKTLAIKTGGSNTEIGWAERGFDTYEQAVGTKYQDFFLPNSVIGQHSKQGTDDGSSANRRLIRANTKAIAAISAGTDSRVARLSDPGRTISMLSAENAVREHIMATGSIDGVSGDLIAQITPATMSQEEFSNFLRGRGIAIAKTNEELKEDMVQSVVDAILSPLTDQEKAVLSLYMIGSTAVDPKTVYDVMTQMRSEDIQSVMKAAGASRALGGDPQREKELIALAGALADGGGGGGGSSVLTDARNRLYADIHTDATLRTMTLQMKEYFMNLPVLSREAFLLVYNGEGPLEEGVQRLGERLLRDAKAPQGPLTWDEAKTELQLALQNLIHGPLTEAEFRSALLRNLGLETNESMIQMKNTTLTKGDATEVHWRFREVYGDNLEKLSVILINRSTGAQVHLVNSTYLHLHDHLTLDTANDTFQAGVSYGLQFTGQLRNGKMVGGYVKVEVKAVHHDLSTLPEGHEDKEKETLILNKILVNFPVDVSNNWKNLLASAWHAGDTEHAVDLNGNDDVDQPMYAMDDGVVHSLQMDGDITIVVLRHTLPDGTTWDSVYMHMPKANAQIDENGKESWDMVDSQGNVIITLKEGETIPAGTHFAAVGDQGSPGAVHPHLEAHTGAWRSTPAINIERVLKEKGIPTYVTSSLAGKENFYVTFDTQLQEWVHHEEHIVAQQTRSDGGRGTIVMRAWETGKSVEEMPIVQWIRLDNIQTEQGVKDDQGFWVKENEVHNPMKYWNAGEQKFIDIPFAS